MLPYIASIEDSRFACFCSGMIFQTPSINEGSRPRPRTTRGGHSASSERMIVQWRRPLDALIRRRQGRARRARVRGYERQLVQLSPHRPVRERASRTSARAFSMHTRCLARWHWRTTARARKGLLRCASTRTKRHAGRTSARRASNDCRRALLGAVEHELGQPYVRAQRAGRDGERAHARVVQRVRVELAGEEVRADRKGKRGARCFVC
jgi:hypothetical protein